MPPLPLHLNTPSSTQLRHDLIPAAVGASIGVFAILVGYVVFIVFWLRATPRLRSRHSGGLGGHNGSLGRLRKKRRKEGLEKIVEEDEGGGRGGVGARGGDAAGETVPTDGVDSGDGDGWEVVRSSSATQEVVEVVGRKGEARAWWRGGRRGHGWWR
ncbi:hypothetical protein IWZ03DRAFT_403062 [Phyllosticta citriasiana]|uniref:Uncharacterized protein n=1 Tax=Phyllosticta citriasiana TaxID=595635 RepID=A0ABR1L0L5_9PEZI